MQSNAANFKKCGSCTLSSILEFAEEPGKVVKLLSMVEPGTTGHLAIVSKSKVHISRSTGHSS
jgi:hypothetical protein